MRCGGGAGDKAGSPAELEAIPAGRTVDIQDIADQVEIRAETRAHMLAIHFPERDSAARYDRMLRSQQSVDRETDIFDSADDRETLGARDAVHRLLSVDLSETEQGRYDERLGEFLQSIADLTVLLRFQYSQELIIDGSAVHARPEID